ncbi:hypothetical protein C8R46DRAFT_1238644 [Mycena filopes]|nr:hypothetical protein C8R46DRAFT_1238644 [Mycena filopes]
MSHRTPPPPPPYNSDDADLFELFDLLDQLSISPDPAPPPALPPPPTPPAPARYLYRTPARSAVTSSWAEAADETQGVSGASPCRLNAKRKSHARKGGYAVFSGLRIGTFAQWNDELTSLIIGVPSSLYQGYATFAQAQAAFDYAHTRGWTRVIAIDGSLSTTIARPPSPDAFQPSTNPLHAPRTSLWYVVYAGINPGVLWSRLKQSPLEEQEAFKARARAASARYRATCRQRQNHLIALYGRPVKYQHLSPADWLPFHPADEPSRREAPPV